MKSCEGQGAARIEEDFLAWERELHVTQDLTIQELWSGTDAKAISVTRLRDCMAPRKVARVGSNGVQPIKTSSVFCHPLVAGYEMFKFKKLFRVSKKQRKFWTRLAILMRRAPLFVTAAHVRTAAASQHARFEGAHREFEREVQGDFRFTQRWFIKHIPSWLHVFEQLKFDFSGEFRALEIGSWQGLSALFLLKTFPNMRLTCVDTWAGSTEHLSPERELGAVLSSLEDDFDHNIRSGSERVSKFKGTSDAFFLSCDPKSKFRFIYIDGSHYSDEVLKDAINAFPLLEVSGVMVFDDYFRDYYNNPRENPMHAINAFLQYHRGRYKILAITSQLIIQKTGDA